MPFNPWLQAGLAAWSLAFEAWWVIGLRTMRNAAGGAAAEAEVGLMVGEKISAAVALQNLALTGALGATPPAVAAKTLAHYRRRVARNRRRLTRG